MSKSESQLVMTKSEGFREKVEQREARERELVHQNKKADVDDLWQPMESVGGAVSGLFMFRKEPKREEYSAC